MGLLSWDSEILKIFQRDFSAFRAADDGRENTVRRITDMALTHTDLVIHIDVRGTAFLKNMVRIIAGTLVDVGLGRLSPADVADALASKDRTRAGRTAPAHGLTLVSVFYD